MHKKTLISNVIQYLESELAHLCEAANNAHLAATDDQSVAETQYDTLAIEAGYLAAGQSRRVDEIKEAIAILKKLPITKFPNQNKTIVGSIVQLKSDIEAKHWYFILPVAGGFKSSFIDTDMNQQEINFTVVTPHSPMGKALINREHEDDIEIVIGTHVIHDLISVIR